MGIHVISLELIVSFGSIFTTGFLIPPILKRLQTCLRFRIENKLSFNLLPCFSVRVPEFHHPQDYDGISESQTSICDLHDHAHDDQSAIMFSSTPHKDK